MGRARAEFRRAAAVGDAEHPGEVTGVPEAGAGGDVGDGAVAAHEQAYGMAQAHFAQEGREGAAEALLHQVAAA